MSIYKQEDVVNGLLKVYFLTKLPLFIIILAFGAVGDDGGELNGTRFHCRIGDGKYNKFAADYIVFWHDLISSSGYLKAPR